MLKEESIWHKEESINHHGSPVSKDIKIMKTRIFFIFALGFASVIANPITSSDKKPTITKVIEKSDQENAFLNTEDSDEETEAISNSDISSTNTNAENIEDRITKIEIIKEIQAVPTEADEISVQNTKGFEETDFGFKANTETSKKCTEKDEEIEPIDFSTDNPVVTEIINTIQAVNNEPTQNAVEIENIDDASNFIDAAPTSGEGVLDIVIENNPDSDIDIGNTRPVEGQPEIQNTMNNDFSLTNYFYRTFLISRMGGVMGTAKGFAPLPGFSIKKRRKQNSRPRFAIRRRYNRYPYRNYRRYSPVYYPYYAFYRPSSLRFY